MTKSGNETISIVGLGKLGMPLAACLAKKGFNVIGTDCDPERVSEFAEGRSPGYEPGLNELLTLNRPRLSARLNDTFGAVLESSVTFIVVPTPSMESGAFSLEHVFAVCKEIAAALKQKKDRHLIVLTSTVMPGASAQEIIPLLETLSNKTCGKDFGFCYSPEFVALGSVIQDYLNPDFVLIGESDTASGDRLQELYSKICENSPKAARMNFINAEIAKLSVNAFLAQKISFANTLARISEKMPGADADVVTAALGMDSRIGTKCLRGAVGYGGPCFPRDTEAFTRLAREAGIPETLAEAADRINRMQASYLIGLIQSKMRGERCRTGILGLSYKPGTGVVDASHGMMLARELSEEGYPVCVYDPAAMKAAEACLKDRVSYAASAEECLNKSEILVIATPWEEFRKIDGDSVKATANLRVIIDCWRILAGNDFRGICEYIVLGKPFEPSLEGQLSSKSV